MLCLHAQSITCKQSMHEYFGFVIPTRLPSSCLTCRLVTIIYTPPYVIVNVVMSLPKMPYIHRNIYGSGQPYLRVIDKTSVCEYIYV